MGVAAVGSSWLAVLGYHPPVPAAEGHFAGTASWGNKLGRDVWKLAPWDEEERLKHHGAPQRWQLYWKAKEKHNTKKQLHRTVDEQKLDHSLLFVSYQQDQGCDLFQRTEVAKLRPLVVNSM